MITGNIYDKGNFSMNIKYIRVYSCFNLCISVFMAQMLLIIILMAVLTSVVSAESAVEADKVYGGTLVWGTRNRPTIINPILTTYSVSSALMDVIFNALVRVDSEGKIVPDLAQRWDISEDGLIYTFYLRKGVLFHDGVELTAEDVKFTYDKIIEPETQSPYKSYFQLVKDFRVINPYAFRVVLKKPCFYFIYRLTRKIAPKHLLENRDLKNTPFNFHPIGTGPFKFKQWKDDEIILEFNPDYYESRPYLDKVVIKTYPDSREVWNALLRGEVGYATFIEQEDYEFIKKDDSFKSFSIPCDYYYAVFYDLDDALLMDKRIREAIAFAVDRKRLIEEVAFGYGVDCFGPFYPESIGFNASVAPIEYNPQKAIDLLARAGWKQKNNHGILEKRGRELEIKVLVDARSDIYKKIIMFVRQELQKIGVKIKVKFYNHWDNLTKEFLIENKPQAHLKIFLAKDIRDVEEHWLSKKPKRFNKLWIYENKKVDELFELGKITQDKEERKKIYQAMHKIIYEDQPACFLYFPFVFHAVSRKFEGVDEFFTLYMPHYTMKDWRILEGSR